jgi:hypothetical protein
MPFGDVAFSATPVDAFRVMLRPSMLPETAAESTCTDHASKWIGCDAHTLGSDAIDPVIIPRTVTQKTKIQHERIRSRRRCVFPADGNL